MIIKLNIHAITLSKKKKHSICIIKHTCFNIYLSIFPRTFPRNSKTTDPKPKPTSNPNLRKTPKPKYPFEKKIKHNTLVRRSRRKKSRLGCGKVALRMKEESPRRRFSQRGAAPGARGALGGVWEGPRPRGAPPPRMRPRFSCLLLRSA